MRKVKIILSILLSIVFAFSLVSCKKESTDTLGKKDSKQNTSGSKVVRFATTSQTADASENAQLAIKLGYIDEELKNVGYKAKYIGFAQAGPAINEAFAAKEIDLACYGDFPQVVAKSNGINIKAIASVNTEQNYALLVQKDSDIKSAKDLEGKKVIVGIGTVIQKYFGDLVNFHKLDIKKIHQINTVADAESIFSSKQADAYATAYVTAKYAESRGVGKIVESTINKKEFSVGFLIGGRDEYLKENPKAAVAILKALIRSQEYAQKNPDKVYELLANDKISKDVFKSVYEYDKSFVYFKPEITKEYREKAERLNEFLYSNKLVSEKINLDDFFDESYYKKAVEELKAN